ncbi:hypothetical protein ES705_23392 [subsurface metagenome]
MGIRTKEFYKFQNKVMENLRGTYLSPNESKYCWDLFRNTCGYGEYRVKNKGSEIAEKTGVSETHVSDVETRLKSRNIIIVSSKFKGFNADIDEWKKFQVSGTFKKFQVSGRKVPGIGKKKFQVSGTPLSTKALVNPKKGVGLKKLNYKETEKLEGKKWLKQVMWQKYSFKEEFIDHILNKWEFGACYDVFLAYEESHGVGNKEAWFLSKLNQGPVPEE